MGVENWKKYNAYLQSEEWRKKREEKAHEQNYTCEICGKVVPTGFNIHHKTYKRLGHEPLKDLMFLCENCHMELHRKKDLEKKNKPKKEDVDCCANCKYSKIITYAWIKKQSFLYCKKLKKDCKAVCGKYKKGKLKRLPSTNRKKKKKKTIKRGGNNGNRSREGVKKQNTKKNTPRDKQ